MSVFGSQDAIDTFLYACALGDEQFVTDQIRLGFFIDVEDSNGNTPLQIASAAGHLGVVELLLRSGANIAKSNCYGWTALHQAGCAGHLRIVQVLVKHGSSQVARTKYGESVLALAASGGHVKIVNYLLSLDVQWKSLEAADDSGLFSLNALLVAAAFGKLDVLNSLINVEDVNGKSSMTGTTAIMLAASAGHAECCQFLAENGADPLQNDCTGRSAMAHGALMGRNIYSAADRQEGGALYFEDESLSVTDVFDALRADDVDLLGRILTASPALKNKETIDGNRTLLIEAASSKNARALKLLLSLGCTVNAVASVSGRNAISHALEYCFEEGILLLLDAGADPTMKDVSGQMALDFMARRMCQLSQHVIRRLCHAGLTVMSPDLLQSVDSSLIASKMNASVDDLKTGKTIFGKLKAKLGNKPKAKLDLNVLASPCDIFAFPCSGPLAFSANTTAGGLLELDPVRVDPLTPPFDRRKLIWTDGAPDDSSASGPPMSSSYRGAETLPPGNSVFTQRPRKQHAKAEKTPSSSKLNVPKFSVASLSGDESTGDESDLKGYLKNMKLDQFESLLKNNEISDLTTFKLLTERDLRDLQVTTMDRSALINAISRAKNQSN